MQTNPSNLGNELSAELRAVLIALGCTLGIIAVYGVNHPSAEEFKTLLSVLCAGTEQQVKKDLSKSGLKHVTIEEVKYVALREGESSVSKNADGGTSGIHELQEESSSAQVEQIVAFLQGEPGGEAMSSEVKELLSEPEKLGQMILEAAAVPLRHLSRRSKGIKEEYETGESC